MNEMITKRNELLSKKIIAGLESRNMSGYYAANKEEATLADGFRGRTPKTGERRSTSYKNRSRHALAPIVAPVSLHEFCFTVSDTLESVDANAFGTCTLYRYANMDCDFMHKETIIRWESCGKSTSPVYG